MRLVGGFKESGLFYMNLEIIHWLEKVFSPLKVLHVLSGKSHKSLWDRPTRISACKENDTWLAMFCLNKNMKNGAWNYTQFPQVNNL